MKVLIVDDEPIIRMDLKELLEENGYTVVGEASDGETAIHLTRCLKPDVVLMDIKMPGKMDGLQAARLISEEGICPVVFLSAYNKHELVWDAAIDKETFSFLAKPVEEKSLLLTLEKIVGRRNCIKREEA